MPQWLEHAWLIASLDAHHPRIRSAHLVLALLVEPSLNQMAIRASRLFQQFRLDELKLHLDEVTAGSAEAPLSSRAGAAEPIEPIDPMATEQGDALIPATPALDQFTTNLTQRAREGRWTRSSVGMPRSARPSTS